MAKAGRPKSNHTIEAEEYRKYLTAQVKKHASKIVAVLIKKALEGDIQAIKELHDRSMGRPAQSIDLTSEGENFWEMAAKHSTVKPLVKEK